MTTGCAKVRITGVSALVTLVRVLMVGAKLMLLIGEAIIKFEAYRVLVHPTVEVNARVANNNLLKIFIVSSFIYVIYAKERKYLECISSDL